MRPTLTPIIVDAPQRSRQWFDARLGNVTGSRAKDTLAYYAVTKPMVVKATEFYALNPLLHDTEWLEHMLAEYPTEYCLQAGIEIKESAAREGYRHDIVAERITGMPGELDPYITKDMLWGQAQEPLARSWYEVITGNRVEDAPLMLHPQMMCGASPDGLVIDIDTGELGNLEIKCLKSKNHLFKVIVADTVPDDYTTQIQMQMWIDDRDWCDFVGYDSRVKDGLRVYIKRVERDDFYIENVLKPGIQRFLDECDRDERQLYAIRQKRIDLQLEKLRSQRGAV